MRKRMKKMTACILTALLGLSIMNFPVHAQETQANQQIENNSVLIQNMESLFIGQSMFKTAVQALTAAVPNNAGPFYVEGDSNGWTYDDIKKTLTFSKNGNYKVTGDGKQTDTQIVINAGITIELTIKNVNCHPSYAGMSIDGTANVTLMLQGENEFVGSFEFYAGIEFNNATGSLTIDGTGSVTATGADRGAGIGGKDTQAGKNITIRGGIVKATGGAYGAGIGGGEGANGANINITGGTVIALSRFYGAGIGGGIGSAANNITINGGTVTTSSGDGGDGIGDGVSGSGSENIKITGGSVKATGAEAISAIPTDGNGKPVYLAKLDITDNVNQIKVDGKDYKIEGKHENDTNYYLYMPEGEHYIETESNVYKTEWDATINSFKEIMTPIDTGDLKVTGGSYGIDYIYDSSAKTLTFKTNENYTVTGNGQETKEQIVVGAKLTMNLTVKDVKCHPTTGAGMSIDGSSTVKLVLEGDNEFVAGSNKYAGIEFNNAINGSLIIDGSGSLFAKAGTGGAGIGGSQNATGNNITISGGDITVNSSYTGTGDGSGAGIGSGYRAIGDNHITINNGTILMESQKGAGIGSGQNATGNNYITINGGNINTSDSYIPSVGIGSGQDATGKNNITINNGTINVYGDGAGIGSNGSMTSDNNITIKGGNITAYGSSGTGIGNGEYSEGTSKITIQGGVVNAKGMLSAIGSGIDSTFTDIDISGGIVNATSGAAIAIGTVSSKEYRIRIRGGTVTATSESDATAIGGTKSSTGSIKILGGSVKANGYQTSGIGAISIPPMDETNNEVYLAKLLNQSGVKKIAVDDTDYKISGNHPDGDTNFYLYLTGKDHIITTNQNKYKAIWDITSSTFTVKQIPPIPTNITTTQTASTITVTAPADEATYGDVEYSMDNQNWKPSNVFEGLDSSKDYIIYVKYKGNDTYIESEVAQKTVKTLPATYTITIPKTANAEGQMVGISINEDIDHPFDLGLNGKVNVKIKDGITNGNLTLTRNNAGNTITSALFVNGRVFSDLSRNIATFTKSDKNPVSISFAKPTQTNIPAGTYSGTVTFEVTYSQKGG